MRITSELAHPIILKLKALVNYNINIMNDDGLIVGSTDPDRLYQIHQGALQVIESKEPILISSIDEKRFHGSRPGVNLPVEVQVAESTDSGVNWLNHEPVTKLFLPTAYCLFA